MARREIGTRWDRENRNNINENFKELYDIQDRAIEEATQSIIDSAKLIWLEPVNTFADIATTYPNPEIGHTVFVRDTGKVYRFYDGAWMEIQQIDAGPVNEVDTRLSAEIEENRQEIEQARTKADGTTFPVLRDRLNDVDDKIGILNKKFDRKVSALEYENLKVGDDWQPAIQAAIDYMESLGGGVVLLPAGTLLIGSTITLPSNVFLIGLGMDNTIIKANSTFTGTSIIKTKNFDILTGQNKWLVSEGIAYGFGIEKIAIDGNSKTIKGVEIYGKRYFIDQLMIKNCWNGGFYSEAGASNGQSSEADMPECMISKVYIYKCKGWAFDYYGPHDGYIDRVYVSGNHLTGSKGLRIDGDGVITNGQCEIGHIHIYGTESDGFYTSRAVKADLIISESIKDNPVVIASHTSQISKLETFGTKNSGVTSVKITGSRNVINAIKVHDDNNGNGIEITGNENIVCGYVDGKGSNGCGLSLSGLGNSVDLTVFSYNGAGGIGYKHSPDGVATRDNDVSARLRNCDTAVNATATNSSRNRIFLAGYGHVNIISGQFAQKDTVIGSLANSSTTKYAQNAVISTGTLNLATTAAQTVDVPHELFYAPNPAKVSIDLYNIGDINMEVDYFRIQYVDTTNVRVGFKLKTALTGTGSFVLQCSI